MSAANPLAPVRWLGMPGHFIDGVSCCYHLNSEANGYRVSTIGCYHPTQSRAADDWEAKDIGFQRKYETFVFRLAPNGEPDSWSEIDSNGYQTEAEAAAGHMEMLMKYARPAEKEGT